MPQRPVVRKALPKAYFIFFWLIEPALTIAGAAKAIVTPEAYASELLPAGRERLSDYLGHSMRGQMILGGLGSCFFLLAMISLSIFWVAKRHLEPYPAAQAKVVSALLVPLAIGDVIHVFLTLLPLPVSLIYAPRQWTTLIWGNVGITAVLLLWRLAWFLGVGRLEISGNVASPRMGRRAKAQ